MKHHLHFPAKGIKRGLLLVLLLLACLNFSAQTSIEPYYRKAEGLSGTRLKAALHDIIQPLCVLGYGGGPGKTWSGFFETDRMEDLQVRDRYSNTVRYLNEDLKAVNEMNIEHIWANSWWGHVQNNAYKDLFNLYPSDASANGRKSNNPIGIVDGTVSFNNGVTKVGRSSSYRTDSLITAWEPADCWKGDFARTYFYMATAYSHMTSLWTTTEGLLTVDPNSPLLIRPWVYQLMLDWAEQDPLDAIERERNEAIYAIQGNRNPFVDYPELCHYIWGSLADCQFYCSEEHGAEIFVPTASEEIDFGLQPLSRTFSAKVQVRGRGLSQGLSLSTDHPTTFSLSTASLTEQEVRSGTDVQICTDVNEEGTYRTTLTLQGSGYIQQVPLCITFVNGIPAYPASDVVCSVSSRRFNANWMNYAPGMTYTLRVYTRNADGMEQTFGTYTTTDTTYQIKSPQANTTYYYRVSAEEDGKTIGSNEVTVTMPNVTPVFSVSTSEVSLTATQGKPSPSVPVTITALAVPKNEATVSATAPFEVSADGTDWAQELRLQGQDMNFFIRFAGTAEEGEYAGEAIVSCPEMEDRIISLSCNVDRNKAFFEDFEHGSKGSYATAETKCSAATWEMSNALIAGDANALGQKCVRMKGATTDKNGVTTPGRLTMLSDKENGCDSLWFSAGSYGTDSGVSMTVSYSTDQGKTWTKLASSISLSRMKRYGYKVNCNGTIRLRFENDKTGNKRINIDNIQMSDWDNPDGIPSLPATTTKSEKRYRLDGLPATGNHSGIVIQGGKSIVCRRE